MSDFASFLPLLITVFGAVVLMLYSVCPTLEVAGGVEKGNERAAFISMGIFALAFCLQLCTAHTVAKELFPQTFNGVLGVSCFSNAACLVIYACGFFTSVACRTYFKVNKFATVEFYSLLLYSACGMVLLTMAQELITAFIALEIMSLAVYVMIGYNRKSERATEAVFKYLMLGAFAGAFFCMGTALIYGAVGSTKFAAIALWLGSNSATTPLMLAGVFLLLITVFFKISAFPFHGWVLDVYEGAANPLTGFMATALKTSIFAVFANFISLGGGLHGFWITVLFWIAVFTMFAGNLIAIGQDNVKRMIAASGIVHSGYLLIALVAIDAESFNGYIVAYYLAAYSLATLGMFAALSYLSGEGEKRARFDDFKGLAKKHPRYAAAIAIFLLSMAGIPPTAGFMGKFFIIVSAVNAGQIALAVLGIVSSILSMWYYLRLIVNMYFSEPVEEFVVEGSTAALVSTGVLVAGVFILGLFPLIL